MMKLRSKASWHRVTNEYIVNTFKQAGCNNCNGTGLVGNETNGYTVCGCAQLAFRRQMQILTVAGKLRERIQRVGKDDRKWLEYREIGLS